MRINPVKCVGCRTCVPYCPVVAIKYQVNEKKCVIDQDLCVECYVCHRAKICPKAAFEVVPLGWPRILRHTLSSPRKVQKSQLETGIGGRGTEEMKTNDVTGRYGYGEVGFTIDVGRPGLGTRLEEAEKIAMAISRIGVEFEPLNPLSYLMSDRQAGKLRDDVRKERVLSTIIEFKTSIEKLPLVINVLRNVAKEVDTVFSVGCICRVNDDGTVPIKEILDKIGVSYLPNGKVNIGLGKAKRSVSPLIKATKGMSFDDIAFVYDETRAIPDWVLSEFYEKIKSEIKVNPDLTILDAGIGTGRMIMPLLDLDVHLVGIDISREMIKKMKEKISSSSGSCQVSLVLGDVTALPFREDSFDFVLSVLVLHLIKRWENAINETKRVIRNDGLFSIVNQRAPELISKTGQKYFDLCNNYSSKGLSGKAKWMLNKTLKYDKTGFLSRISKRFLGRNNFWGSGGQTYLKKQSLSIENYVIQWQEEIDTDQVFNHLGMRILSSQWRIPREIHEKAMLELGKWKSEEIRKNGSLEKIHREFKAVMVRFG